MPIGSRDHPERGATLDSALDSVETTVLWMREQD
jgi:hypothetical protein